MVLNKKKKIIFFNTTLKYNINLNYIKINNFFFKNHKIIKSIQNIIIALNLFFFKKISFYGKGFKIRKSKVRCLFQFNKSHKIYLKEKIMKLLKINKFSLLIITKKKNFKILKIKKILPINLFTKKGIRNSQQILLVKKK